MEKGHGGKFEDFHFILFLLFVFVVLTCSPITFNSKTNGKQTGNRTGKRNRQAVSYEIEKKNGCMVEFQYKKVI